MARRTMPRSRTTPPQDKRESINSALANASIVNIIGDLPVNPTAGYPKRDLAQIRQIVVHHSAVSSSIGPRRIAKMQVAQGKPGIAYHFFVAHDGKSYQTNPLSAVSAHTGGHDQNSLAICFAGNFTRKPPNAAQLKAGRVLIQTLSNQLNIPLDNIVGASELIATQSPGKEWLQGQRWKNRLLQGLTAPPREVVETPTPTTPADGQITALNNHIAQLTAQLAQAQAANQRAQNQIASLNNRVTQLQTQRDQTQSNNAQITALRNRIAQLEADLTQARSAAQAVAADATEIAALNTRIAQLEAEPARARSNDRAGQTIAAGGQPNIQNVINQLPHHETVRYPNRNRSDIKMIVIHHTAVAASVTAKRIAKGQVERGKAGITYHYLIRGDGTILQTNYHNTTSQHTKGYDQNSLAIAFAGNFTDVVPTEPQLEAGAQLLSYLQQQFHIPLDNIKGATELINTQSPGKQWLKGQRWKQQLFNKLNTTPGGDRNVGPTRPDSSSQVAVLQARIAELETLLSIAQEAALSIGNLPANSPPTASGSVVSQPIIQDIVDDLPHHLTKRYQTRPIEAIQKIIVHHSAVPASISAEQIATFNVARNDWPGLGFHYFIGVDGVIQQTNDLETISYHAGNQNATSIGVAFAGDFDESIPTQAQITAAAHLIAWLLDHLNIPLTSVHGHKEFANTTCPGQQWDNGPRWRNTLFQAIQDNLAGAGAKGVNQEGKALYHYLLLWQTANDWAKQDLLGATNYIAQFRPTLGFSVDDAIDAEYVTIVGGPLGISAEDEARLRASGCQVERIAGNSERATKALLDNLARRKQRFLTLER